jgi:phosphosulfolactate phosphohydrolase-like enzyme
LLIVCSGTFEEAAYEDVLGAGALCGLIWPLYRGGSVADSALMARRLYCLHAENLLPAVAESHNGRRLMARPPLREDVPFCLQRDRWELVAEMDKTGVITRRRAEHA